jgi:hypothetical protein
MIYSPPPLLAPAAFAWCIHAMSLSPSSTDKLGGVQWLGNVGLMDLVELKKRKAWVASMCHILTPPTAFILYSGYCFILLLGRQPLGDRRKLRSVRLESSLTAQQHPTQSTVLIRPTTSSSTSPPPHRPFTPPRFHLIHPSLVPRYLTRSPTCLCTVLWYCSTLLPPAYRPSPQPPLPLSRHTALRT